ncbi:MAG: hypothetical protein FP816_00800 [Desulfobacteraceae bacterium]|nr:hypothetical protein [Desulfobacteraceae bacterium]MBU3948821.1 hypothetical protein [Pseudomonadota bacterium]
MNQFVNKFVLIGMFMLFVNTLYANPPERQKDFDPTANTGEGMMQRIDFGNSYIMGQKIQSGAVYLLQRKKSEIKSMLKPRENYREEILEEFNNTHKETGSDANNLR